VTGSVTEHTQLWWSVRPHLAFPTVEIRICDGQPELADAQALAAFATSLAARILRAVDEGEPLADQPPRLLEENMWRAIRYGLSGELIDLDRGDVVPARARLERLLEWAAPVADEIGAAPYLALPERNAAERQIARREEGATLEEIYAEQVGVPVRG
jgi:carboxylate-amine ligase